jgi:hypothetical protein
MASLLIVQVDGSITRHEIEAEGVAFDLTRDDRLIPVAAATRSQAYRVERANGVFRVRKMDAALDMRVGGRAVNEDELNHADTIEAKGTIAVFCVADEEPAPLPLKLARDSKPPILVDLPPLTGLPKLLWFLTRMGRARRALARALEAPDAADRAERASRAVGPLLRGARPGDPAFGRTLENLLVFLCWHATKSGVPAEAERWLDLLETKCPSAPQRLALRWNLVKALWRSSDLLRITRQSKALVADRTATPEKWAGVAADLVERAYVCGSLAAAREIVAAAHPAIKQLPQVQAMASVCECPASFTSLDEAKKWAGLLKPQAIADRGVMRADACLALAAAAEWAADWKKMTQWTIEALCSAPAHKPTLYWVTRARLHSPAGDPAAHLGRTFPDSTPEWKRLRLAVELYRRPDLEAAEAVVGFLGGLRGRQDKPEVTVLTSLVARALRGKEPTDAAAIGTAVRICKAVEAREGQMPWTQLHIARQELLVDRRYADAYKRLERRDLGSEPGTKDCATVARIMAGARPPSDLRDCSKSLQIIAAALNRIESGSPAVATQQLADLRGDQLLTSFPCLREVVSTTMLVLKALEGEDSRETASAAVPSREAFEPWVRWLHWRALLILRDGELGVRVGASLADEHPTDAWAAESWARNQQQSRTKIPEFVSPATAALDRWAASSTKDRDPYRRLSLLRLADHSLLGERWDALSCADASYELDYAAARRTLLSGHPEEALALFKKLDSRVSSTNGILAAWWRPLTQYWLGVVQARTGVQQAGDTLKSLIGGPLDAEARAQLALLELRAGHIDQAEHWLPPADVDRPGLRYARALVFARRGAPDRMREELESPAARRTLEGSAYELPARRLITATLERLGRDEEAERQSEELLAVQPHDEITIARQGRLKLRLAYQKALAGALDRATIDSVTIVQEPIQRIGWRRHYVDLREMLTGSGEALSRLRESAVNSSWLQVMAHRLLGQGNPQAAFDILAPLDPAGLSERTRRTRAILSAWNRLARPWACAGADSGLSTALAESGEELQHFAESDSAASTWRQLVNKARVVAAHPDERQCFVPWSEFGSQPFAKVPGLWAAEPEVRRQSAAALKGDLAIASNAFQEEQALLLSALTSWEIGDEAKYLEYYELLEPVLENVPVGGPQLWVAATLIRFARKDWRGILESQLPDCVADLSNDDVRLLIALAYARAAADECSKGDIRNALQNARKGQSNLEALVEVGIDAN